MNRTLPSTTFSSTTWPSRDRLNANLQFGRSTHGSDGPPSLTAGRIFLHRYLQNEEAGNVGRVAILATEQLFELLSFG